MKNTLFKKGLVVGIILLFIGLAFIPSFNAVSIAMLENHPPEAPTVKGKVLILEPEPYDYKFNAIDPDGDDVRYFIDWDDGNTEWTDYYASGEEIIVNHSWIEKDFHLIRARANDTHGALGPWGYLQWSKADKEEDCIECQSNGTLCILYLFLRNRAYFVLLRLQIYLAFLYGFGFENLLYIFTYFIYIPQVNKFLYYEEKLVEYDCGVPPIPY